VRVELPALILVLPMALLGYQRLLEEKPGIFAREPDIWGRLIVLSWFSGEEHRIAIAEETIFLFDGMAIGYHSLLVSGEGAYQSQ
jgi:hypothetical protein